MGDVVDLGAHRRRGISRSVFRTPSPGRVFATRTAETPSDAPVVSWRHVLGALSSVETRQRIVGHVRGRGFTLDDLEHRRAAREALADAITYAEDWLAGHARHSDERVALRDVRRRLEWELWP